MGFYMEVLILGFILWYTVSDSLSCFLYYHHVSHTNKGAETKYSKEYIFLMVIQQLGTRYRHYKSLRISAMRQANRTNKVYRVKQLTC